MGVDFLLLLTAAIWGFAFVAQRIGMASVGPFTFNAIRFLLGGLSLIPLAVYLKIGRGNCSFRQVLTAGIISGLVLFFGASLQQVGIVETTAGNAGFITGLYVVIVPVLGLFLRQRTGWATWLGAALAAVHRGRGDRESAAHRGPGVPLAGPAHRRGGALLAPPGRGLPGHPGLVAAAPALILFALFAKRIVNSIGFSGIK